MVTQLEGYQSILWLGGYAVMDMELLERLVRLRDSGALTDAEFVQQKQLLDTRTSPARTRVNTSTGLSTKSWSLIGAGAAIFVLIVSLMFRSGGTDKTSMAEQSPASSDGQTAESATARERDGYSHDLYDRPAGLTGESAARYDALPSEGQEYVDEQMAKYDAACARSNAC